MQVICICSFLHNTMNLIKDWFFVKKKNAQFFVNVQSFKFCFIANFNFLHKISFFDERRKKLGPLF